MVTRTRKGFHAGFPTVCFSEEILDAHWLSCRYGSAVSIGSCVLRWSCQPDASFASSAPSFPLDHPPDCARTRPPATAVPLLPPLQSLPTRPLLPPHPPTNPAVRSRPSWVWDVNSSNWQFCPASPVYVYASHRVGMPADYPGRSSGHSHIAIEAELYCHGTFPCWSCRKRVAGWSSASSEPIPVVLHCGNCPRDTCMRGWA